MAALFMALPAQSAFASDPGVPPNAHHEAARIISAELAMSQALEQMRAIAAQAPATGLVDSIQRQLALDGAAYDYRNGARQEELRIYELASYASVESSVRPLIPPAVWTPLEDAVAALHSLYILEGIDQYYLVNVHFVHPYSDAEPVAALHSYYLQAQQTYGVDWSYLASINFIESNFGRVNGPSSANAQGPMQFLPGTWQNYGQGGNINDPHDSIMAAARYLVHYGAPSNMRQAIWHYNLDYDYVDAVEFFARAMRADPTFLDRLYYWNTTG
ncbi:MAG TPA: lytic transglycosylase domain-containing protein [Candidatus Dormibacteraeota bacterium]|nr:lytic transglycosylase domain-containing protein [Candidatus Dormibacteraeota bacterium]